ncbi:MAG: TIGR00288 family NYN domain-containing protein [Desulfomicrobium escambiense]|nr:TIGR00288 family NYN domain-containing protein [Desulfomicrobium escambiense]
MSYLGSKKEKGRKKIGLLVDGPNMLRKEFQMDLEEIRDILKDYGDIKMGKVFLNQYASEKLVEAVENQGFEPVICTSDVDVRMAVEGVDMIYNPVIDTLALVTRDADLKTGAHEGHGTRQGDHHLRSGAWLLSGPAVTQPIMS